MKAIANLLFEARILKKLPRSGFHFLGVGGESVAEHGFLTTFIGYVLAQIAPGLDQLKVLQMCLLHDLSEARTGDLNYVQKQYVAADEARAVA
ncbi:MAG: HD domain-containing protein, partial [Deltaproteobacteria bacterium]